MVIFWECWKRPKWALFRQKVKIDPEASICCHEFDLSNITNWQHIGGGPSDRNFCRNFCLPRTGTLNFHLCRFFSLFGKITTFQQQKQLLLFLSNMTPKCCRLKWCCWGPPHSPRKPSNWKKLLFWELRSRKWLPIGDLGGSSVAKIFIFLSSNKNCPLFVKKGFFYLGS